MTTSKLNTIKQYYFIALLIGLLIRSINVYSLLPSKYDGYLFTLLAFIGGLLLFIDFVNNIMLKRFPYSKLLISFILIIFISTFINRQYGIVPNLKLIIWSCIYYFLAYEFSKDNYRNDSFFNKINITLIASWFILSLSSMIMFFLNYGFEKFYSPRDRIRVGFLESRLFGLYGDPNYAATGAVIVIILSLYYLFKVKKIHLRVFLVINILLQFIYIVLSGSRTGELIGYVLLSFTVVVMSVNSEKFKQNKLTKLIMGIIFAVCGVLIIYFLIKITRDIFTNILNLLKEHEINGKMVSNSQSNATLVRKDVADSNDVSNMRFSIWKSALEIFKSSWLFGTSPKNMIPYAKDHVPTTFIAQNGFIVHNSYLNVLASTGILGGITFFTFCIKSFFKVIINFDWKRSLNNNFKFIYFLIVAAYALFGCINSEFVLEHTVGSLIFWLFLGRLIGSSESSHKWS